MEVRVCAVVPVLDEEKFITRCIDSLLAQTLPIDILVVDGGSRDGTLNLLSKYGDSISIIDNPGKRVAQARNLALEHIGDDITHCLEIIGHSWVDPDHIEKRVNKLLQLEDEHGVKIAALGCRTESSGPTDKTSQWVEGALSTPIGSGGGQFQRFRGSERTKTPAFCLHRVEALREIGGWDERFITSQDSDLSMRMLAAGWQIWRSDVSCVYMHKRSSLSNWWKMCHRYGFWRTKVILRHPKRIDLREFLPVFGLILIFTLQHWWWAPAAYSATLLLMGVVYRPKGSGISAIFGIPLCLVILHTSFTIGLFDGLIRKGRVPNDRS
jgi:glycosyltransferase involved in cell wall biosynthesis